MGRMLEALTQREGQRSSPVSPARIPEVELRSEASAPPQADDAIQEEYPYIEVGGGPGKKMEASAAVLASPPPQTKADKKSPAAPHAKIEAPLAPTLSQARPMTVAFEPWPVSAKPCPATEIISYHHPEHPVSQQYDSLFEKLAEGSRLLLFAGARGSGTTTVLLNLAFSGCMRFNKRLAVVETNMARPVLDSRLGLSSGPGWAEYLAGSVGLEKALRATAHPLLCALTCKESTEDLPAEALRWVFGWLRDRFDLVLVDGPDLEEGQKLAALASVCDGLYLVLPQNTGAHSASIQNIGRQGTRIRGIIHTQFESL